MPWRTVLLLLAPLVVGCGGRSNPPGDPAPAFQPAVALLAAPPSTDAPKPLLTFGGRLAMLRGLADCGYVVPSADGKRLLVSNQNSPDHALRVWDTTTGSLLAVMNADHTLDIPGLTFAPSGRWVAATVGHTQSGFVVWDADTGTEVVRQVIPAKERETVPFARVVGFTADRLWVMDARSGEFRLLDLPSGKVVRTVAGFPQSVHAAVSSDGKRLAVSGWKAVAVRSADPDGQWEVVGTFTDEERNQYLGSGCGTCMASMPHPPHIRLTRSGELVFEESLFSRIDGRLPKREPRLPSELDPRPATPWGEFQFQYTPDGRYLWRRTDYHEDPAPAVVIVEVCTGRVVGRIPLPSQAGVAVSADGTRLFTSNVDTTLSVWDLPAMEAKYLPAEPVDDYWAALASADPKAGYSAVRRLAADPKAVGWLQECYAKPRAKVLAALIADLGSPDDQVAGEAGAKLFAQGPPGVAELKLVIERRPNPKAVETAERMLPALKMQPYQPWAGLTLDQVRDVRAVEVLERIGTAEAKDLLGTWVKHESAVLRLEAAAALARLGQKR